MGVSPDERRGRHDRWLTGACFTASYTPPTGQRHCATPQALAALVTSDAVKLARSWAGQRLLRKLGWLARDRRALIKHALNFVGQLPRAPPFDAAHFGVKFALEWLFQVDAPFSTCATRWREPLISSRKSLSNRAGAIDPIVPDATVLRRVTGLIGCFSDANLTDTTQSPCPILLLGCCVFDCGNHVLSFVQLPRSSSNCTPLL